MYLSDVVEEAGPIDPFKTTYNKQVKKENVIEKVTLITHNKPKVTDEILAE